MNPLEHTETKIAFSRPNLKVSEREVFFPLYWTHIYLYINLWVRMWRKTNIDTERRSEKTWKVDRPHRGFWPSLCGGCHPLFPWWRDTSSGLKLLQTLEWSFMFWSKNDGDGCVCVQEMVKIYWQWLLWVVEKVMFFLNQTLFIKCF